MHAKLFCELFLSFLESLEILDSSLVELCLLQTTGAESLEEWSELELAICVPTLPSPLSQSSPHFFVKILFVLRFDVPFTSICCDCIQITNQGVSKSERLVSIEHESYEEPQKCDIATNHCYYEIERLDRVSYLPDSLALGEIILEASFFIDLDVDLTGSVNCEVTWDTHPVELTHIEKESVKDFHLGLLDLLHDLLGHRAWAIVVKVCPCGRCPWKDGATILSERYRLVVWVVPGYLDGSVARLF